MPFLKKKPKKPWVYIKTQKKKKKKKPIDSSTWFLIWKTKKPWVYILKKVFDVGNMKIWVLAFKRFLIWNTRTQKFGFENVFEKLENRDFFIWKGFLYGKTKVLHLKWFLTWETKEPMFQHLKKFLLGLNLCQKQYLTSFNAKLLIRLIMQALGQTYTHRGDVIYISSLNVSFWWQKYFLSKFHHQIYILL